MAKPTPLYQTHVKLSAQMVDFAGWDMPVQYQSVKQEHQQTRANAGLFDLCHMGRVVIRGANRVAFLQSLVTIDVAKIPQGRSKYTFFCNENGEVLDDLLVSNDGEEIFLVINASNTARDLQWLQSREKGEVETVDQSDHLGMIAIQGPLALKILGRTTSLSLDPIPYYGFARGKVGSVQVLFSRTGYTGEDGFELFCPAKDTETVWNILSEEGRRDGLVPVGLGARDTLRLEMAFPLYGHELDFQHGPMEAGLEKFVNFNKGPFAGRETLLAKAQKGVKEKLVGLVLQERGVPRQGCPVLQGQTPVGQVTSGTFSPSLDKGIALAYVRSDQIRETLSIEIRGKSYAASLCGLPFYQRKK